MLRSFARPVADPVLANRRPAASLPSCSLAWSAVRYRGLAGRATASSTTVRSSASGRIDPQLSSADTDTGTEVALGRIVVPDSVVVVSVPVAIVEAAATEVETAVDAPCGAGVGVVVDAGLPTARAGRQSERHDNRHEPVCSTTDYWRCSHVNRSQLMSAGRSGSSCPWGNMSWAVTPRVTSANCWLSATTTSSKVSMP